MSTAQPWLRKSRFGCKLCKLRKVKCDEIRPVCGNCAKRYIDLSRCEYPISNPKPPRKSTIPTSMALQPISAAIDPSTRTFEMRLMDHYTRTVCFQLPNCKAMSRGNELWQTRVPLLAFSSELILDIVLSISSLHLQSLYPHENNLKPATTKYLNRALAKQRVALATIDERNAEALLVAAIMISTTTWLHSHRLHEQERYEPPIHAYNMIKGVRALYLWRRSLFDDAGYGWFSDEEPLPVNLDILGSNTFLKTVRDDLTHLTVGLSLRYEQDAETFDLAVEYVFRLYAAYASNTAASHIYRFIGTMPVRLPGRFLQLLEGHDVLAMALLARALALLKGLDYAWWIQGRRDHDVLVHDLRGMYTLMPRECAWAMDWPLRVLEGWTFDIGPQSSARTSSTPAISM